jgi:hypothetical protein
MAWVEGSGEEESTGVGDLAKVFGGEERIMTDDILRRAVKTH